MTIHPLLNPYMGALLMISGALCVEAARDINWPLTARFTHYAGLALICVGAAMIGIWGHSFGQGF